MALWATAVSQKQGRNRSIARRDGEIESDTEPLVEQQNMGEAWMQRIIYVLRRAELPKKVTFERSLQLNTALRV